RMSRNALAVPLARCPCPSHKDGMPTRSLTQPAAELSDLMVRWLVRKGRIRSAERTEVHLVVTTSFHELTFCPSMRTLGLRKEVRHASKTSPLEAQPPAP